jgi:hypothetical protein
MSILIVPEPVRIGEGRHSQRLALPTSVLQRDDLHETWTICVLAEGLHANVALDASPPGCAVPPAPGGNPSHAHPQTTEPELGPTVPTTAPRRPSSCGSP